MLMPLRLLVERRDDVSLPAVMGRRSRDRRAPVLLLQTNSSHSISPTQQHSKIASFYTGKNKNIVFVYKEMH